MARTKQAARKANQIPNLIDSVNAAKAYSRLKFKSNQHVKEMAPIRSKNKKDKLVMVSPPSIPPRSTKYLNVGLLRGKTPNEVALIIRESRDPCDESSEFSASSSPVVSATGSDEEEVVEHEEIPLGGEYDAYDDDDGNGGNRGNEEAEIEEEKDEGNDDEEDEDGNDGDGGGSSDEKGDEDDGNERNDGGNGDGEEEEEIQKVEENVALPKPKEKFPITLSARHIPPERLQLTRLSNGKAIDEPKDDDKVILGYDSSWARTINDKIITFSTLLFR